MREKIKGMKSLEKVKKFFTGSEYPQDWMEWLRERNVYHMQLPTTAKLSGNLAGKSVLDIGTGPGRFAFLFGKAKSKMVIGLDISKQMIEIARSKMSDENNISFIVADAEHLPFGGQIFDVVNCQEVFVHLSNPRLAAKEMIRVTRDGGSMIANATTLPSRILLDLWKILHIARGAREFNKGLLFQKDKADGALYIRYFLPSELMELFAYEGLTLSKVVAIGCFTGCFVGITAFISIFPRDKYPFNLLGMFTTMRVLKCR